VSKKVRGSDIYRGSLGADRLAAGAIKHEIALPLVTTGQQVTAASLATLDGWTQWTPGSWNSDQIEKVEVELEYESAGSGDVDLYNVSDSAKVKDLVAPTGATSHTLTRVDVTAEVKALSANKNLGIQAAGDGTNTLTVHKATLIVTLST